MPVIGSLDAHRRENVRQRVDLPREVLSSESPSPSCSGSVFDVAATETPRSTNCDSSLEISVVFPGSSSSNSSIHPTT